MINNGGLNMNSDTVEKELFFNYVSEPCGSGKTTSLCNLINHKINSDSERFIVVQNTQALSKQTADMIKGCKLIISDLNSGKQSIIELVIKFLQKPTSKVLIVSDKTFFKIPMDLLNGWQIWLDDVTNFHSFKNINDSNSRIKDIIYDDLLENHEFLHEDKKYLVARNKKANGFLINKILQELSVISENDYFIMNNDYFIIPEKAQLSILGWRDIKKYLGLPITFMGANFENSLIYKARPSIFKKVKLDGLKERNIPLENRLKVYYFSEEIKLSKAWKDNNPDKLIKVYDYLKDNLIDAEYYWTNNNSDRLSLKKEFKISPDARGLNNYKNLEICIWLACMMPDPTEAKLCESLLDITGKDIHNAREYESLYQFVLRGISRNFESTEVQIVYVFDKYQAESLTTNIEHIPGVLENVEPGVPGRPKGAKNVSRLPALSDTKLKRFSRWKNDNPGLEIDSFRNFLNSDTNRDLSTEDKDAMLSRFEKAVQKKAVDAVRNTDMKNNGMSKNNPL